MTTERARGRPHRRVLPGGPLRRGATALARRGPGAAVALLGILVALSGAELLARLATKGEGRLGARTGEGRQLWTHDGTLGWRLRPGSRGKAAVEGATRPGPDAALVEVNRFGLRGPGPRQNGARRIVVLGDSFAMGLGVDDDHTVARRLEGQLGREWEVVNAAVAGYATDQQYLLYERLLPWDSDIVLLVMCDNDFEQNVRDAAYELYRKPVFRLVGGQLELMNVPVPQMTALEHAKAWLAAHSWAWAWARWRRPHAPWARFALERLSIVSPNHTGQDPELVTAALVEALKRVAAVRGARLLVTHTGHRGEKRKRIESLFVELRRRGVACLSVSAAFRRARQAHPKALWDFGSDAHWNVDAHRLIAELVAKELGRRGWLAPRPQKPLAQGSS